VAGVSADGLVELLRRAHAGAARPADTKTEVAAHILTPPEVTSAPERATLSPSASTGSAASAPGDAVPEDLARHERYQIKRLLGQGGMGSVYAAEHRVMQRTVALKVINRAYTANAAAVERFRREVRAAARLAHPNIVHAYDAENAGETHFLVMEYVEGVSLGRLVKERGPLPVAEACEYIRQAALGLQHAYERGMVHRDVKPDNLIRCADGRVKVLDFGLAALTAERGSALTDLNAIMGTPEYMAPEQAEDARTADIQADIYSLGCTLYHLLTGSVPYPAATPLLKILAHRDQPLPSVRQARPDVPPELARVVTCMMAKRPKDRYPTPGEVAAALEPFTNPEAKRPRKRRPLLVAFALAALCGALVLAGGVVYRIQTDKGELVITTETDDVEVVIKQGGKEVRVLDTKTAKQITLALRSGVYELELKGAPEGLKLNITQATLTRGETVLARIERVAAAGAEARGPKGGAGVREIRRLDWDVGYRYDILGLDLSPDGQVLLASRDHPPRSPLFDLKSGMVRAELPAYFTQFTPDGKQIVGVVPQAIRVFDTATGELRREFVNLGGRVFNVGFKLSPDGKTAVAKTSDMQLALWDIQNGRELHRWWFRDPGRIYWTRDGRFVLLQVAERTYRAWDTAAGKETDAFAYLASHSEALQFLPGGREVVTVRTTDQGEAYKIHDLATGKVLREITWDWPADLGPALRGGWGADCRLFLFFHKGDILSVRDFRTGLELERLPGPAWVVRHLVFSADGRHAAAGSRDGQFVVWQLPDPPAAKDKP
jgi:tRNA A-37 threonylcarbamoyl transferase component Bud32